MLAISYTRSTSWTRYDLCVSMRSYLDDVKVDVWRLVQRRAMAWPVIMPRDVYLAVQASWILIPTLSSSGADLVPSGASPWRQPRRTFGLASHAGRHDQSVPNILRANVNC